MNETDRQSLINKAAIHLKQDISDDFWPDIIGYEDFFSNPKIPENFKPKAVMDIDIPKPTLVLRPGHFIDIQDRLFYQWATEKFSEAADAQLQPQLVSFGYRTAKSNKYFLNNNILLWKKFKEKQEKELEDNSGSLLVQTDINAFFEHIRLDELIRKIGSLFTNPTSETPNFINTEDLKLLFETWVPNGIGLPQGNQCSSFLANIYLDNIDALMTRKGYKYFRFVDDITIIVKNRYEARKALRDLTYLLRPLNLHLNSGKTEVVSQIEYLQRKNALQPEMQAVEYGIDIRNFFIAIDKLKEIWRSATSSARIDTTKFKFCLNRFRKINSDFPKVNILQNKLYDPAYTDVVTNYLKNYIEETEVQDVVATVFKSSLYEWQKIHLLKLILKAAKLKVLYTSFDPEQVFIQDNFMLIGYLINFILKFGDEPERQNLIHNFYKKWAQNERISRYFFIALQYLPPTEKDKHIKSILRLYDFTDLFKYLYG